MTLSMMSIQVAGLFTCKLIHAWFPNTLGEGDGNFELITNIFICSCVFLIVHPGSKRVGSNNKHNDFMVL